MLLTEFVEARKVNATCDRRYIDQTWSACLPDKLGREESSKKLIKPLLAMAISHMLNEWKSREILIQLSRSNRSANYL